VMLCAKNYQNQPVFYGVIQKIIVTRFNKTRRITNQMGF